MTTVRFIGHSRLFAGQRLKPRDASLRPPLLGQQTFEDGGHDRHVSLCWRQAQLGDLCWIHDRFGHAEEHFDHQSRRHVLANDSGFTTIFKNSAEVTLDQAAPPALHQLEHLRRFAPDVAHEWRLNLLGMSLHARQKMTQGSENVLRSRGHNLIQVRLDAAKFFEENSAQQIDLAGKRGIESLFTHAKRLRQIIHGDAAKPMSEEMSPRRSHDALRGDHFSLRAPGESKSLYSLNRHNT